MTNSIHLPHKSVLLIGMHDSGKSNFLFRFWLALETGKGSLVKDCLPADLDYLKTGGNHLLQGNFAPHTSHEVYEKTEISIKSNHAIKPNFSSTLIVPDLPGEQIPRIFHARQWSNDWEEKIQEGCSCLLFIRVDSKEIVAPLDWLSCVSILGGTIPASSPEVDANSKAKTPTQVVLVDWLQFLREAFTDRVGGFYKPKVGIVVTAWDLAPLDQKAQGAAAWIATNFPMLSDFVQTNDDVFDFEYFGVSVVAGDLDSDEEFKASYMDGDPQKAGEITHTLTGTVAISNDMTLPVAWTLGLFDKDAKKL